jgi:hypothetical protein
LPLCSSVADLRDDAFEADLSDQLGRVGVELDWFGLIGVRYAPTATKFRIAAE